MPGPGSDERRPADAARNQPPRPAQTGRPEPLGRVIAGRYRLDRILGTGSMGTVWAAYDEVLRRRVAIKEIYLPDGAGQHEAAILQERTLREARAIAALSHPNVITLYDILTLPGGPVIVMEMLAARSLGEVLKESGRLTVGQAATVGLAVAAGLSAAHAAGITHRDVKPGNVLIGGDGRVKLTDFGIARSAGENPMTATGLLLGSPAYIAPEVAEGATAGPPADAWGLGALLFACVEGRPPYDKGAPVATLMSVVHDPVPQAPRAGPLAPVIRGLMVKDPAQRLNLRQARSGLRPLADDPVETRLVFSSPAGPATPTRATLGGAVGPPGSAGPVGAGGPPTVPGRPSWVDEAPPRTDRPAATRPGTAAGLAGTAAHPRPAGPTGTGARQPLPGGRPPLADPGAPGRAAAADPGAAARPPMPPPPWAKQGLRDLAPLPVAAPDRGTLVEAPVPIGAARRPGGGTTARAAPLWPSRSARRWIAVLVFLVGVAVAYFGIKAIAAQVTPTASAWVAAPISVGTASSGPALVRDVPGRPLSQQTDEPRSAPPR